MQHAQHIRPWQRHFPNIPTALNAGRLGDLGKVKLSAEQKAAINQAKADAKIAVAQAKAAEKVAAVQRKTQIRDAKAQTKVMRQQAFQARSQGKIDKFKAGAQVAQSEAALIQAANQVPDFFSSGGGSPASFNATSVGPSWQPSAEVASETASSGMEQYLPWLIGAGGVVVLLLVMRK